MVDLPDEDAGVLVIVWDVDVPVLGYVVRLPDGVLQTQVLVQVLDIMDATLLDEGVVLQLLPFFIPDPLVPVSSKPLDQFGPHSRNLGLHLVDDEVLHFFEFKLMKESSPHQCAVVCVVVQQHQLISRAQRLTLIITIHNSFKKLIPCNIK